MLFHIDDVAAAGIVIVVRGVGCVGEFVCDLGKGILHLFVHLVELCKLGVRFGQVHHVHVVFGVAFGVAEEQAAADDLGRIPGGVVVQLEHAHGLVLAVVVVAEADVVGAGAVVTDAPEGVAVSARLGVVQEAAVQIQQRRPRLLAGKIGRFAHVVGIARAGGDLHADDGVVGVYIDVVVAVALFIEQGGRSGVGRGDGDGDQLAAAACAGVGGTARPAGI